MNPPVAPAAPAALPRGVSLTVAFLAGWAIMQLEILGGRLLAPWFGYSIYQWGGLIGVVMTALAAGYWLGGRLGDRADAGRSLLTGLGVSALWVMAVVPFANDWMPALRGMGPATGAVVATAVMLGLPSMLLAMTSPVVIRLTASGGIARTAGRVYAVSTVGSIAGTFVTAFWIIPELGSSVGVFLSVGLILVAAILLAVPLGRLALTGGAAAGAIALGLVAPGPDGDVAWRGESVHNIITVEDVGSRRYLYLNYTWGAQTVWDREAVLTGSYYDWFSIGPQINGGRRVLFLGSAGGTALRQMTELWPEIEVTGVELDAAVVEVANEWFGLRDQPRIEQVVADARWFLTTTEEVWDIVDIDLYVTGHIPFFTATREFFALVRDRLSPDGIVMMNILAPGRQGETLVMPFVRTVRTAFPSVFLIGTGNHILVASRRPMTLDALRRRLSAEVARPEVATVMARALTSLRAASAGPEWPVFTDDLNDVEFRTWEAVVRQ